MVTKEGQNVLFYYMKGQGKKKSVAVLNADIHLKQIGKRIKQLRMQQGYTSYEYFAYEHNISRAQFGRYENGQDLRISSLIKVVNALGITLSEFFKEGFE